MNPADIRDSMPTTHPTPPSDPRPSRSPRGPIAWPGWVAAVAILVACWLPANRLPTSEEVRHVPNADKLVHAAIFATFGLAASRGGRWRGALVIGMILAIASELGQATPWVRRDASVADGLADVAGLLIGVGLAWGLGTIQSMRSSKANRTGP